jgi:hypothetical protein
MAQFSKGDTFTNGEQVTGARLNQLVDSATLLAGAITDQTNITAGTVASNDSMLLYDLSATALREAAVSDIIGSNLPIVSSSIAGGANSDILITPNDGTIVSGVSYTSADGLTVTVTSTGHILTVGQVILITGAGTGYNGTFRVATTLANSFTYVMTTAATAGSGTLSYTKKGLTKVAGNETVAGNLYVDGNQSSTGTLDVVGATKITGNTTVVGNLSVSGTTTLTGIPTAPTATALTNTTQIATTAFVRADNNIKAWVNYNNTAATLTIRGSYNVTSVTDNAVGDATVNFTTALASANYAACATHSSDAATSNPQSVSHSLDFTTSSVRIRNIFIPAGSGLTYIDSLYNSVIISQ